MKLSTTFILVFSLGWFVSLNAQTIEETRAFANEMYEQGNYRLALRSLQRIAFFQRENPTSDLYFKIAQCKLKTGDYKKAAVYFDRSYFLAQNQVEIERSLFGKIACLVHLKDWNETLAEIYAEEDDLTFESKKRATFYKGLSHFALEDFEASEKAFQNCISEEDTLRKTIIAELFEDERRLHYPNPKTAKILSIITPGAGQFYAGDYKNGFNSLLLNGGLLALGIRMAYTYSVLDVFITVFPWSQRYYSGGYERAEKLAKKERAFRRKELFTEVLKVLE